MNEKALEGLVLRIVLTELAKKGECFVPVSSSNRHVHLSQADVERLFGPGYRLTRIRDLQQPGQFAANESVTIETGKGSLSLRVVGPARNETQVELTFADCFRLGVVPVLRISGETKGTPGCTLVNGGRRISIDHGVIVAARHLHMSPAEALGFGLRDGDVVALQVEGPRAAVLENVVVRTGDAHSLEVHIDKEEANTCGLEDGRLCRILVAPRAGNYAPPPTPSLMTIAPREAAAPKTAPALKTYVPQAQTATPPANLPRARTTLMDLSAEQRRFLSEEDVLSAVSAGYRMIRCAKDVIITPLARDAAASKGVELIVLL